MRDVELVRQVYYRLTFADDPNRAEDPTPESQTED
jgi:hypothetical protein